MGKEIENVADDIQCISQIICAIQDVRDGQFYVTTVQGRINLQALIGELLVTKGLFISLGLTQCKVGGVETLAIVVHIYYIAGTSINKYFVKDEKPAPDTANRVQEGSKRNQSNTGR